jgi:uncharacterized protein YodC (DUF2158 family)
VVVVVVVMVVVEEDKAGASACKWVDGGCPRRWWSSNLKRGRGGDK